MKRLLSHAEVFEAASVIARSLARTDVLFGVPRGGIPAAYAVAAAAGDLGYTLLVTDDVDRATVIIDDIYDSGKTAARYADRRPNCRFLALFDKRVAEYRGQWLVMPWELTDSGIDESGTDIIVRLLQHIGEDPTREGLQKTPERVLKAWTEWAQGYKMDAASLLTTFEDGAEGCNELVIVNNIPVVSKCEHHLADILGIAHVGYIPNGRIVGLSKINRLVDMYGRRLQVQERLTVQIADALMVNLQPIGVGVVIRASHACMSTRGVKVHGSVTTTSAMRGVLFDKPEARSEFLALCRDAERSTGVGAP